MIRIGISLVLAKVPPSFRLVLYRPICRGSTFDTPVTPLRILIWYTNVSAPTIVTVLAEIVMPVRRLPRDEIGQRGVQIYESKLRVLLEPQFHGQFVAIDVETEDCEVATEAADASDRLWARRPDAQVLIERIGYPAAFNARRVRRLP